MIDDAKNAVLKQKVAERSKDPSFKHHAWFVKYHLEIVEQIAHEVCDLHPEADRAYVDALVWLHDYEKIIELDNEYNTELAATRQLMAEVGYSADVIDEICGTVNRYNARQNLQSEKIELQIVSSSDAASHLVGPFFTLYWYENNSLSIEELQQENLKKIAKDWDTKITLPEVRQAFEDRRDKILELAGKLPQSYLS